MPKVYSCPKCGAKLKKTDTECAYCGCAVYFDEDKSTFDFYENRKNYNTEKNSDFDYKYHYKSKRKKKKIIKTTIFLAIIVIITISIITVIIK